MTTERGIDIYFEALAHAQRTYAAGAVIDALGDVSDEVDRLALDDPEAAESIKDALSTAITEFEHFTDEQEERIAKD